MQTYRTSIESLHKISDKSSWRMRFTSPTTGQLVTVPINSDGGVEIGPRLSEVLYFMEKKINHYPFEWVWNNSDFSTSNNMSVKVLNKMVAYAEISAITYKKCFENNGESIGRISDRPVIRELIPQKQESEDDFSILADVNEGLGGDFGTIDGGAIQNTSYMVALGDVRVIDGDTIEGTVLESGDKAKEDDALSEGKRITIRFAGIDTPETDDKEANNDYCYKYKVTGEESLEIGKEAEKTTKEYLNGNGIVVVDMDSDDNGMPRKDKYERYVGAVYKTSITDAQDVFESEMEYGIHINKTLLVQKSKSHPQAPLAMPYDYFIDNVGYNRLDVMGWLFELGIRGDFTADDEKVGDIFDPDKALGREDEPEYIDMSTIEIKHEKYVRNQIDFVKPYDDRFNELYPDGKGTTKVRIGDVSLVIPPLAIDAGRTSTINKVKTLRSKSSLMTNSGSSNETITLQLYFHDLDSINGHEWKTEGGRTYYMDGLRPLIAQFKKAPFLPIDNEYINETLDVHDVALVNLSVSTVPGFPHSISATLTLAKFDSISYMPQTTSMGEALNYPLLRWYYQEAMVDRGLPYRTYLSPIPEDGITNDIGFTIAEESDLIRRHQAVTRLQNMNTPTMYISQIENKESEVGKQIADGKAAQRIIGQYERYLKAKEKGLIKDYEANDYPSTDELLDPDSDNKKSREAYKLIYGEMTPEEVWEKDGVFAPFQSRMHFDHSVGRDHVISIRLYSGINASEFDENQKYKEHDDGSITYRLNIEDMNKIKKIVSRAKHAEVSANEYIEEYEKVRAIAEATESHLAMRDYHIGGDLTPTAIKVIYENNFSSAQMQLNESPTFQYLGSQDPYIQIEYEADQTAVSEIQELLDTVDRYAKEYRIGITSGFFGVKNSLFQLFGITSVMPETVQINTVPDYPGRFQVSMVLCGFNKTQKRMEQLEGISPIYGDPEVKDREAGVVDRSADDAVIEYKMSKMEVYPDLELPTYKELEEALPHIGADIDYFDNPTGAKYVDPDFYVSTEWTFRQEVLDNLEREQLVNFKDFMGVQMFTSTGIDTPMSATEDMWNIINEINKGTTRVSSGDFTWGDAVLNKMNDLSTGGSYFEPSNLIKQIDRMGDEDRSSVAEYLEYEEYKKVPTLEEWQTWGYGSDSRLYSHWLNDPQPESWEVYEEIYKYVDRYWVNDLVAYDDTDINNQSSKWESVTYATPDEIYKASWKHISSKRPELVKNKDKVEIEEDELQVSDYKKYAPITRERIANIIKALLDFQTDWKQFNPGNLPIMADKESGGMGTLNIKNHAINKDMAQRLLWDWKYHVEYVVTMLYDLYTKASSSGNVEFNCRPWDWMVRAYNGGFPDNPVGNLETPYYLGVYRTFKANYNDRSLIYGTPSSYLDPRIMQRREGLTSHEYGVVTKDREALLKELKAMGYSASKLEELETKPTNEIVQAYEEYAANLFAESFASGEDGKMDETTKAAALRDAVRARHLGVDTKHKSSIETGDNRDKYAEQYDNYLDYMKAQGVAADANDLVSRETPVSLYRDMMTDMLHYDMRGRLARAFPTFQMYIVDEGRWMSSYRLWDNLYGFNALQSIDVHRSREIAADTCVIKMTNIYSNLTSRPLDIKYDTYEYDIWDNLILGKPNEQVLDARKELLTSMLLQTGARIHLRMGYGSSARHLPVVFNGTITELNAAETVEIVGQGDGIELTNVISGDPDDDNKGLFTVEEPRDLLCNLLTSKGNWMKDMINYTSGNKFFTSNPLGIQHFGRPGDITPPGNLTFYNTNYGEAAQNIYSSNGMNTFSQWVYSSDPSGKSNEDAEAIGVNIFNWEGFIPKWQMGDEDNVRLSLYNQTFWDIATTLAYCSPDYIAAVHPFEMRSTFFFGKPYWRMAYKYDSHYEYDSKERRWTRYLDVEHRKPYMQFHNIDSYSDIISNDIKASSENIKTCVIVNYDGKPTMPIYADYDINYGKQKTTVIEANIISKAPGPVKFWTAEKQAMYYGMSALRDYMKQMYQGSVTMLGTPTLKPHDMIHLSDESSQMSGNFLARSVTHHFSHETGFITSVTPDAVVVNDDKALMSHANWLASAGIAFGSAAAARRIVIHAKRKITGSAVMNKMWGAGKSGAAIAREQAIKQLAKTLPKDNSDVQDFRKAIDNYLEADDSGKRDALDKLKKQAGKLESKLDGWASQGKVTKYYRKSLLLTSKGLVSSIDDGAKAFKTLKNVAMLGRVVNPLTLIGGFIIQWAVEGLLEQWDRKRECAQAVLMMPLTHYGREFTAGINGHKGMVVGDSPGRIDEFYMGLGFDGTEDGFFAEVSEMIGDTLNTISGSTDKTYAVSHQDLRSGNGSW